MKLTYLFACVGLFGCGGSAFTTGTGGSPTIGTGGNSTGAGGNTFVTSDAGTVITDASDAETSMDAGCIPITTCSANQVGLTMPDGCGGTLICCGAAAPCPGQVQGYPSACLDYTCQPFNNTIFSPACASVCGDMNKGAWNNCLIECQNQSCTVQQSCTNCNFLFSAEPDCLSCLHTNFPGQSCGG